MEDRRFIYVPLGILGVGLLGVFLLVLTRPEVKASSPERPAPLVRVLRAKSQSFDFVVRTQGIVKPRTESDLVPQVPGEIVWVSPNLVSGGFFSAGEPLARIEAADYEADVEAARAALARAESEHARALTERNRQRKLAKRDVASRSRIDDAENAYRVAEAGVREANARLGRTLRDLDRTELRAPFEGRVRSEKLDVGQFVERGKAVGALYAVDFAEVRLPLPDRELRFLDVPLGRRLAGEGPEPQGPAVRLHAEFAGQDHEWYGRIVRTEGEIDAKSRMVNVVAQVKDPYGLHGATEKPPLAVGLFVEAEITGRTAEEVFVLPRAALRPARETTPDHVHIVDSDSRLRVRPVEVLRTERESVVVSFGVEEGELISLSPLPAVVDGMAVRIAGEVSAVEPSEAGTLAGVTP